MYFIEINTWVKLNVWVMNSLTIHNGCLNEKYTILGYGDSKVKTGVKLSCTVRTDIMKICILLSCYT